MNFLRRLFTSPEVSDLISALNGIKNAEDSIVFAGKQVYGLQFLEFINDLNINFHDSLSQVFDIGKKMCTIFENSIPERNDIPNKLLPIKEKQAAFNKLRKQKSSLKAKAEACKQNFIEKLKYLHKLESEGGTSEEIKKAKIQVNRAESEEKGALYVMVEFSKIYDQEEIVYMKTIYDILTEPLDEWAMSETKQLSSFSNEATNYLTASSTINCETDPDPELLQLLQKLNEELGE
ncbi:hypothetical protein M9Y10_019013 [Tritrichomonas musculus]|uniref:BAR domain-containing protein n=1 Tax=Tritrichomonas musculus TaxID=1915356 RepID=A0ABR2HIA6_9EUKA